MDTQSRSSDRPRVDIVVCVWGNEFLDRLFEYMIPSLVGCLRASRFHEKFDCTFKLNIRLEDGEALENYPSLRALHGLLKVEVRYTIVVDEYDKRATILALRKRASNEAYDKGDYALFLAPNCVYSTTLFDSLARAIDTGRDTLFALGFRTVFEETTGELDRLKSENGGEICLTARETAVLALRHIHPEEKKWLWNASESTSWLARIYFRSGPATIHACCWHLFPLLVRPRDHAPRRRTVDEGAYLAEVVTDRGNVEVITDSDRGFFLKLSDKDYAALPTVSRPMSIRYCARWARGNANAIHRVLFQQTVVVHTQNLTDADLEYSTGVVSAIASEILRIYDGERFFQGLLALRRALSILRILDQFIWRFDLGILRRLSVFRRRVVGKTLEFVLRGLVRVGNQPAINTTTGMASYNKGMEALGAGRLEEASQLIDSAVLLSPNEERQFYSRLLHTLIELKETAELTAARLDGRESLSRKGVAESTTALLGRRSVIVGKGSTEREAARLESRGSAGNRAASESMPAWLARKSLASDKRAVESAASQPGAKRPGSGRERVVFAVVVWGKDYVEPFLDYTVRTLLAPGNLPAVKDCELIFSIVTDKKSRPLFERHPVFAELKKLAHVEFFMFSPELTGLTGTSHYTKPTFNFYRMYGALDHISIHFARALHAHIFFVVADSLYSDGTVANILKYIRCGYHVCVNASLVARKEAILAVLEDKFPGYKPIALSGKDLADICFRYRHDYISQRLMIEPNTNFDRYPRELYFPVQGGLAVHALYQHPWAISADAISRNIAFDYHIVDFNLMARIFASESSLEKLKVIEDSSEAFIGNFAPQDRAFHTTGQPFDVKRFVLEHMNSKPIHWHIWNHRQMIWCDTGLEPGANPQVVANEVISSLRKVLMR